MAYRNEAKEPLDIEDAEIMFACHRERYGFDGDVITTRLREFQVDIEVFDRSADRVRVMDTAVTITTEEARWFFLVCCLAEAALGPEELETLIGYDAERVRLTCRRLYMRIRIT